MKSLVLLIIAVALVWGGWVIFGPSKDVVEEVPVNEPMVMEDGTIEEEPMGDPIFHALITYTDDGFDNSDITINKGDTVRFVDQSTNGVWVGSNSHPTHTNYPKKSEGDCLGSSFDTCRILVAAEFWEFTFDEVGKWSYHNHAKARDGGVITVE
ncbi:hypothetical protein COB52_00915 [Candidatus Kaiserbacteria bacterium]|nr:MAG: hypothetical protein COB52_00915 [Candidatus Kaiserbacteria bacterium]